MENRIIKFRGFHEVRKIMFSPEEMGRDQLTIMPDGSGFINVHGESTKLSELIPEMIPMQFTGLKDKNGNEIYEGDIIVHTGPPFDEFDDGIYKFVVKFEDGSFWNFCEDIMTERSEVIGNIFQHPELV